MFIVKLYIGKKKINVTEGLNVKWIDIKKMLVENPDWFKTKNMLEIFLALDILNQPDDCYVLTNWKTRNKPISRYKFISLIKKYFYNKNE